MDYKALYEQQQQETDREHQRYLEVSEKYSNTLWEVCQELNIENDDTSQNIIKEIKQLIEENEIMKEEWIAPEDADEIHDHYHEAMRDLKAQNDKINLSNREAWARARSLEGVIENKERQIADLKQGQIKEIKTMKNKCLKSVCKLNKKIKELQKQIEELQKDVLTDEPEVETCRECNTKRECLSDIFITIRELDGTESVMCGMCSLNHFKSKS